MAPSATKSPSSATKSWSGWLSTGMADLAKAAGSKSAAVASAAGAEVDYGFPSPSGLIVVREERQMQHLGGSVTRARCNAGTGQEFDLRRLRRVAPPAVAEGARGFVALAELEALNREVELLTKVSGHPNLLRCLATLAENDKGSHCRLLLTEPCACNLVKYVEDFGCGGALPSEDASDIGLQLASGLERLHQESILYGSLQPEGILRGKDGQWKLADFSQSALMPIAVEEWVEQQAVRQRVSWSGLPPEVRSAKGSSNSASVTAAADVWLLGHLLAGLLLGGCCGVGGMPAPARAAGQELVATPADLAEPMLAHLWLLLHWPLAEKPDHRPSPSDLTSLLSARWRISPSELLGRLPRQVRQTCCRAVAVAARQLAVEQAASEAKSAAEHARVISRFASLPLALLRAELADTEELDDLCDNCGFRPWEEEEKEEEEEEQPPRQAPDLPVVVDLLTAPTGDEQKVSEQLLAAMMEEKQLIADDCALAAGGGRPARSARGAESSTEACSSCSAESESGGARSRSESPARDSGDEAEAAAEAELEARKKKSGWAQFETGAPIPIMTSAKLKAANTTDLLDLGCPDLINL